ncbi:MAG: zinc-binding dehydrogenase [Saprospiraceae bacterium]|nr:zinc-binding dehydrogenase [Saprospiraceae bacterium]
MKAIVLKKYGQASSAFEFMDREMPVPGDHEVLIKVSHSGINFADIMARNGMYDDAPKPPSVIGYDVAGEIVSTGKQVADLPQGSKVLALTRFGGYAEYVVASNLAVAKIPEGYDPAAATALATQGCTAYHCAIEMANLHAGDVVLVQAAAGGVGSMLVQLAKHKGCFVYGTASASKQDFIRSLGVDHAIDYTSQDFEKVISEGAHKGVDVVFDSLGGQAYKKAFHLLKPCGKMVCFGAAEQMEAVKNKLKLIKLAYGFGLFSPISLLMQSRSVMMVNMLRIADLKPTLFKSHLLNVISMAELGVVKPFVSKVFPVEEVAAAHDFIESRQSTGKVVLRWTV